MMPMVTVWVDDDDCDCICPFDQDLLDGLAHELRRVADAVRTARLGVERDEIRDRLDLIAETIEAAPTMDNKTRRKRDTARRKLDRQWVNAKLPEVG